MFRENEDNKHTLASTGNFAFTRDTLKIWQTVPSAENDNIQEEKIYHEIQIIGDGNCALNALGAEIVRLILEMKDQKINHLAVLIKNIHEQRTLIEETRQLYAGESREETTGAAYTDLAGPLGEFLDFINEKNPDPPSVKKFIKFIQLFCINRQNIAAASVALAAGLRPLGAEKQHQDGLQSGTVLRTNVPQNEDENLILNKEHAGQELLVPLAKFFGIRVLMYDNRAQKMHYSHDAQSNENLPTMTLINKDRAHWNVLMPNSEMNSTFAKNLAKNSNEPAVQQNHRKHLLSAHMHDDSFDTSNNSLTQRSVSNLSNLSSRLQQAISEKKIERSVKVGTETIDLVSLVRNCQSSSGNDDEPLAKCLQLEEIDIFLNAHCDTLMHKSEAKHQDVEDKKQTSSPRYSATHKT